MDQFVNQGPNGRSNDDVAVPVVHEEESSTEDHNMVIVEDPLGSEKEQETVVVEREKPEPSSLDKNEDEEHEKKEPSVTAKNISVRTETSSVKASQFIKVREPGKQNPPYYRLISVSKFLEHGNTASLHNLVAAARQEFSMAGDDNDPKLYYRDSAGDWIYLSSDQVLGDALAAQKDALKVVVKYTNEKEEQLVTSFVVHLKAAWDDGLEAKVHSDRLLDEKGDLDYDRLARIAANVVGQPAIALSFSLVGLGPNVPQQITCTDDLRAVTALDQYGATFAVQVELIAATVIHVCFPTNEKDKTLSRRIPVRDLLNPTTSSISYDNLLLTVADSLGTEEFVLTWTMKDKKTKFFITCLGDLVEALRTFPGEELVIVPEEPHDNEDSDTSDDEDNDRVGTGLSISQGEGEVEVQENVEIQSDTRSDPILRLSYQGRDRACIFHPLECITDTGDDKTLASYWKLVGVVLKSFHLATLPTGPPPFCLFYVAKDGTKAEIASDSYLAELVRPRFSKSSGVTELHVRVEPVAFSLSSYQNGFCLRNFALSHILYHDGTCVSFKKLVRLARMVDPVVGLTYHDRAGQQVPICTDEDLGTALHLFPRGDLLLRPRVQANPYVLPVRDAHLSGRKARVGSWTTPNIMLRSDNAMALWEISALVPGRYRITTKYWRDLNHGSVFISVGVVSDTDQRAVMKTLSDLKIRAEVLLQVRLEPTGLKERDFSNATSLGEFNFQRPMGLSKEFLVVSAFQEGQEEPDVFVSDMELVYVGLCSD